MKKYIKILALVFSLIFAMSSVLPAFADEAEPEEKSITNVNIVLRNDIASKTANDYQQIFSFSAQKVQYYSYYNKPAVKFVDAGTGVALENSDKLVAGKKYQVTMFMLADPEYTFDEGIEVFVNDEKVNSENIRIGVCTEIGNMSELEVTSFVTPVSHMTAEWKTVEFGSYPQSEVKDKELIANLNNKKLKWVNYGYYTGTNDKTDGRMKASNIMSYADVKYKGEKYRAVKINACRPNYTGYPSKAGNSYQYANKYCPGETYWFKFDKLEWYVLDGENGLIMCATIIDAQPYSKFVLREKIEANHENIDNKVYNDKGSYACDWETSSLRNWLNKDFYKTAFSAWDRTDVKAAGNLNKCVQALSGEAGYRKYDGADTQDKVYLLAWDELKNEDYGFSADETGFDLARICKGSDYAKCQGLYTESNPGEIYDGCSTWWERTPGNYSSQVCFVDASGISAAADYAYNTYLGVRPVMHISSASSHRLSGFVRFFKLLRAWTE